MKNDKALPMLDNAYSDYLMKKINRQALEKKVGILLEDISDSDKHFEVCVVANTGKDFFGMRIFPVINDLLDFSEDATNQKISFAEISKKWKSIKNWYVEVDNCVFDRVLGFTPQEITAFTLHELGHTVQSDEVVEQFYRAYQEAYMRMKVADKASLKVLYMLYTVPMAFSCLAHSWIGRNSGSGIEVYADRIVEDLGYGDHMISGLSKMIRVYGNPARDQNEIDKEIETSVKWANLNVGDLVKRKNTLKDSLHYQAIRENSPYLKALGIKLLTTLGFKLRENYTGTAVESVTLAILEDPKFAEKYNSDFDLKIFSLYERRITAAIESANNAIALEAHKIKKPPSQYDIDAIAVEVDRITNHHDRIYVLDLIYSQITDLETFSEMMEVDKSLERKYSATVASMLSQLEDMRKVVLKKHNFNNDYKLFVKYPEGYEG